MPGRVSLTFIDRAGTYIPPSYSSPPPTEAQPGSSLDQLLTRPGIKFLPLVLAVLTNILMSRPTCFPQLYTGRRCAGQGKSSQSKTLAS